MQNIKSILSKTAISLLMFLGVAEAQIVSIITMNDNLFIIEPSTGGETPDGGDQITTILKHISTGAADNFAYGIDEYGYVWGIGTNRYDQLSADYGGSRNRWSKIPLPLNKKIQGVSSGRYHSYALDVDGGVWGIGDNQYGQLGVGHTSSINYYTAASGITESITKISGGFNHAYALDVNGDIWSTGHGSYGQIGNGSSSNKRTWVKSTSGKNFIDVRGTVKGGFAIDGSGALWYTGDNEYYQGGFGSSSQKNSWTRIDPSVFNGAKIVSASGGWHHSILLDDQGNVWGSGADYNDMGENGFLGGNYTATCKVSATTFNCTKTWIKLPVNNEKVLIAEASPFSTYAVTASNELWSTGYNYSGQLGIGTKGDDALVFTKTNMSNVHSIYPNQGTVHVFDKEGDLWVTGSTGDGVLGNVTGDTSSFVKADISELIIEE